MALGKKLFVNLVVRVLMDLQRFLEGISSKRCWERWILEDVVCLLQAVGGENVIQGW